MYVISGVWIIDQLNKWFSDKIIELIKANLNDLFSTLNDTTSNISTSVGQTPQSWNSTIFNLIRNISNTAIVPIAVMILTAVMSYELISMVMDRNNMHDFETFMFFKWVIKAFVSVLILSHTFDIVMAFFDVGQWVVTRASSVITTSNTNISLASFTNQLSNMNAGALAIVLLETLVIRLIVFIASLLAIGVVMIRFIEIYLYTCIAPIPLATFGNNESAQIGRGFLRNLAALAFQGLFILVIMGIYGALVRSAVLVSNSVMGTLFSYCVLSIVLVWALLKTDSTSKAIFNAR